MHRKDVQAVALCKRKNLTAASALIGDAMDIAMMWRDDTPARPLADKIQRAADYYAASEIEPLRADGRSTAPAGWEKGSAT